MMSVYDGYSIDELLKLVRCGDDAAFSDLVLRYTPLINRLTGGFVTSLYSYDEAFSDSCVALHKAALSYDLNQSSVTFGLYARICIYRRLCDSASQLSKEDRFAVVDLNPEDISDGVNIESRLVSRERMQEYLSRVRLILSDYEYRVFLLYIEGDTTSLIAEKLGKTSKSVDNAKARIFKHLRSERDKFSDLY